MRLANHLPALLACLQASHVLGAPAASQYKYAQAKEGEVFMNRDGKPITYTTKEAEILLVAVADKDADVVADGPSPGTDQAFTSIPLDMDPKEVTPRIQRFFQATANAGGMNAWGKANFVGLLIPAADDNVAGGRRLLTAGPGQGDGGGGGAGSAGSGSGSGSESGGKGGKDSERHAAIIKAVYDVVSGGGVAEGLDKILALKEGDKAYTAPHSTWYKLSAPQDKDKGSTVEVQRKAKVKIQVTANNAGLILNPVAAVPFQKLRDIISIWVGNSRKERDEQYEAEMRARQKQRAQAAPGNKPAQGGSAQKPAEQKPFWKFW